MSPSLRGRGLKYKAGFENAFITKVALFTRAWIEITWTKSNFLDTLVALFTRAWIEIWLGPHLNFKSYVALFTRAWIEIPPL